MTLSPFLFRVNDEKVSRGYLQALATKMAEELESLRNVGTQTLPTRPLVSPMHKSTASVCLYRGQKTAYGNGFSLPTM